MEVIAPAFEQQIGSMGAEFQRFSIDACLGRSPPLDLTPISQTDIGIGSPNMGRRASRLRMLSY